MLPLHFFSPIKSFLYLCLFALLVLLSALAKAEPPALMLANVYDGNIELKDYWISEKLDGVRAYWDGRQLISRQGYLISAPTWFTADFPTMPLDGELWLRRNSFEQLSATVRQLTPNEHAWQQVSYQVFDMPMAELTFDQRLIKLQELGKLSNSRYLRIIHQFKLADEAQLLAELQRIVSLGGEGLMLHRGASLYRGVRSNDLLKLKTYEDAEAIVLAHLPGRGKYDGMLGSLLVETPDGIRFKLGTGFRDAERVNPPPIGSLVTYKFFGKTRNNVPRFASFLRVRSDLDFPSQETPAP